MDEVGATRTGANGFGVAVAASEEAAGANGLMEAPVDTEADVADEEVKANGLNFVFVFVLA